MRIINNTKSSFKHDVMPCTYLDIIDLYNHIGAKIDRAELPKVSVTDGKPRQLTADTVKQEVVDKGRFAIVTIDNTFFLVCTEGLIKDKTSFLTSKWHVKLE